MKSRHNLHQVGMAFHNFHGAFGKFPGTINTQDGDWSHILGGKTQPFSWRVAILPYMEQQELYEKYRFDEPWDSEHNLKLLDKMPDAYRSPYASDDQEPGETNIMGFAGEHTALGLSGEPDARGLSGGHPMSVFTDGIVNTLLLVESKATVPWTKPEDITADPSQAIFFDDHPLIFLMADGVVDSMETIDVKKLKAMITRDGGEVTENFLRSGVVLD